MARPFADIWQYTREIYGALSEEEARCLYTITNSLPNKSNFVEIGSYCGRSSSVMGLVAADNDCDFVCVDCFITDAPNIENVRDCFRNNMLRIGAKYELYDMTSEEASKIYKKQIDFLFIDGDHSYAGIKLDCDLWLPKLKKGGIVALHDYKSSWEGVKKAVDKLTGFELQNTIDSIIIKKKL